MSYGLSIAGRAAEVDQPLGGYLPVDGFAQLQYKDGNQLSPIENLAPIVVEKVVAKLAVMRAGLDPERVFDKAIAGSRQAVQEGMPNATDTCLSLVEQVDGSDTDKTITAACKLVGSFEMFYKTGRLTLPEEANPSLETVGNIRVMVERCDSLARDFGPVLLSGFTFEGGYTDTVSTGDGDLLLEGGLYEIRATGDAPGSVDTLHLLMCYIMGLASTYPEFDDVEHIGIFDPRLNREYRLDVSAIPEDVIRNVSREVIGYVKGPRG